MPYRRSGMESQDQSASPLVRAAQRLLARIESMEEELERLRSDNAALHSEVRDAVSLFSQARPRAKAANGRRTKTAAGTGQRRRRRKAAKGRATPAAVTPEVVRAVIAKLGPSTASEIAREITSHGEAVSGRAVRFLAERAGAHAVVGEDGQRRYVT